MYLHAVFSAQSSAGSFSCIQFFFDIISLPRSVVTLYIGWVSRFNKTNILEILALMPSKQWLKPTNDSNGTFLWEWRKDLSSSHQVFPYLLHVSLVLPTSHLSFRNSPPPTPPSNPRSQIDSLRTDIVAATVSIMMGLGCSAAYSSVRTASHGCLHCKVKAYNTYNTKATPSWGSPPNTHSLAWLPWPSLRFIWHLCNSQQAVAAAASARLFLSFYSKRTQARASVVTMS